MGTNKLKSIRKDMCEAGEFSHKNKPRRKKNTRAKVTG